MMKMRYMVSWFILVLILGFSSCDMKFFTDSDGLEGDELIKAMADTIMSVQEAMLDAFQQSVQQMDTAAARQKILDDFSGDPAIRTLVATYEGWSVTYRNGHKGVVTLLDGKSEDAFKPEVFLEERNLYDVPPTKKALYLITADTDINGPGEKLAVAAKVQLNKPGFAFEIARGTNFNLNKLKNLEGYGIIHIWSHGGLFNGDVSDPYLCTDETFDRFNHTAILANQDAWNAGQIGFNTRVVNGQSEHRFFVFPAYVYENNDFRQDSTMVFGGFCYSSRGDWKKIFTDAGALTYFGYDWVVGATVDGDWMTDMYVKLCDTSRLEPYTLPQWFSDTNPLYKSKKHPSPENSGYTLAHLWGHLTKAAYWEPEVKNDILRIDVDLFIEDARFRFVVDGSETYGNGAHRAFVSSREGTSTHIGSTYKTTFNRSWFGTDYTGEMIITFRGDGKLNVSLTQHRQTGSCYSTYVINKNDLPYSSAEGAFIQKGMAAQQALSTSFNKQCTVTYEELYSYNNHANDYFRVDVVYR
jgi:hypothetical protein